MRLSLYKIKPEFTEYLRNKEPKVADNKNAKQKRPFVGAIMEINSIKYYAPLTSPKSKHVSMRNNIDFIKINDGKWGAININNMIPVPDSCVEKININQLSITLEKDKKYKELLINQITWCNSNKDLIYKKADKLYKLIANNKLHNSLVERCCNFKLLEKMYQDYVIVTPKKEKYNNKYIKNYNFKESNNIDRSTEKYDIDY